MRVVASGAISVDRPNARESLLRNESISNAIHVGERRRWQARLLSRLWPGSDTLIVDSMNQLVIALRVSA